MKLRLEIDVDDEKKPFTLSAAEMVTVYQTVMAQIDMPEVVMTCILPMWLDGARNGDSRRTVGALSPLASLSSWTWPMFDVWNKRFKAAGRYPAQWTRIRKEASSWRHSDNAYRMLLLEHMLSSSVYRRLDYLQWQVQHRFGRQWELQSYGCDVEREVAHDYAAQIDIADWSTWPPFYPADMSRIMLHVPTRRTKPRPAVVAIGS